jgi:hypothetical protein
MVKPKAKAESTTGKTTEWKWLTASALVMTAFVILTMVVSRGSGLLLYAVPHMVLALLTVSAALMATKLPQPLLRAIAIIGVLGAASAIYLTIVFGSYFLNP